MSDIADYFCRPFPLDLQTEAQFIYMNPHKFGSDRHIFVDLLAKTHYWKEI